MCGLYKCVHMSVLDVLTWSMCVPFCLYDYLVQAENDVQKTIPIQLHRHYHSREFVCVACVNAKRSNDLNIVQYTQYAPKK